MPINLSIFFRRSRQSELGAPPEGGARFPAPRQAMGPFPAPTPAGMPVPAPVQAMGPFAGPMLPGGGGGGQPFHAQDSFEMNRRGLLGMPQLTPPETPWSTVMSEQGHPGLTNEAAQAQLQKGWSVEKAAVAQSSLEDGCGEASLAFIQKASRGWDGFVRSEKQERDEVRATAQRLTTPDLAPGQTQVNLDDGTTAQEMAATLGTMGIDVTQGMDTGDASAMSSALRGGQFLMAMVDSNALLNSALSPGEKLPEPGSLHWVTLDGFNSGGTEDPSDDKYRVKDPVHGEYWVSAKDFQQAVEQGQQRHGGGGILALEKRQEADTQEERHDLAKKNLHNASRFSRAGGHGSRRFSVGESS